MRYPSSPFPNKCLIPISPMKIYTPKYSDICPLFPICSNHWYYWYSTHLPQNTSLHHLSPFYATVTSGWHRLSGAQPALQRMLPNHCLQSNLTLKPECVAASLWKFFCGFNMQIKSLQAQLPFSSPLNNTGSQHHSPKWSALCSLCFCPIYSPSFPVNASSTGVAPCSIS